MIFLIGLVAIGVLYLALIVLLWRFQERIVFQPPAVSDATDLTVKRTTYRAADGCELFAYIVGPQVAAAPVVLAFHGNAELARWMLPWANAVSHETGACIVIPEYRGYDGLAGEPSYGDSRADALAALELVREVLHVPSSSLVYFGHSLGSAIAAELAQTLEPRALILQAPFTSAKEMSRRLLFPLPDAIWKRISRVHFNTVARVSDLSATVWVAHGCRDLIVPVRMGRAVFTAARHRGELLVVDAAGHNDVPTVGGDAYMSWLTRAIHSAAAPPIPAAREETRSGP